MPRPSQGSAGEGPRHIENGISNAYLELPHGFGSGIWELNGQRFEFLSVRSGLKPLIQKLNEGNAHIVLLCKPDDFGDEWEYVQQVLQALYSTHRSDIWFPAAKPSP